VAPNRKRPLYAGSWWWFFRAIDRRVVSLGRAVLARGHDTINTTQVAFDGTDSCVSDVAPAVVGGLALGKSRVGKTVLQSTGVIPPHSTPYMPSHMPNQTRLGRC